MGPFEPQQALRPRGIFRIAGSSLASVLRSLPALLGMLFIFGIVTIIALVAIAIPIVIGSSIDQNVGGNEVGIVIALLMAMVAIPFFLIWGSGTNAALLSLLGSRAIGQRQGAGQAYSIGLRRALPLLGTDILFGFAKGVVTLPTVFLGIAAAFFIRLGESNAQPAFALVAFPLAFFAILLGLVAIHLLMRLLFAGFTTIFEELGPVASLERAWALSHRHSLRIFGYIFTGVALLAGAMALSAGGLSSTVEIFRPPLETMDQALSNLSLNGGPGVFFSGIFQAAPGVALLVIPSLAVTLLGLWFQTALMMLYFDMRHRDEGFGRNGGLAPDFEMDLEPSPSQAEIEPSADDLLDIAPSPEAPAALVPDTEPADSRSLDDLLGSAELPAASDDTVIDAQPPAPWELARLAQESQSGSLEASETRGELQAAAEPRPVIETPHVIEAVIPDSSASEADAGTGYAHAADLEASPSESQARWRIVDRLLRWLPEAEEDDDAPVR